MREATDELVGRFERGSISRRELVAALLALAARPAPAAQSGAAKPIQLSGIDHVALRVSDVPRSARFYTELFGATLRSQSQASVFLDVGDDWIALFGPGVATTGYGASGPPGVDHLSFHSVNARGADERMRVLREHGLEAVSPPGSGRVYFKDPDGNILQLS
jgi:catechol 2,3-dioxygenase-like lactoylglutathione lyase family enzyme